MRAPAARTGSVEERSRSATLAGKAVHRLAGIISVFSIGDVTEKAERSTADTATRLARIELALDREIAAAATPEAADALRLGQALLTDIRQRFAALRPAGFDQNGGVPC